MLGILGRKGAGKDSIADYLVSRYDYTKRAFAAPLKAAAQVLFGFTDEQVNGNLKETQTSWGITPRAVLQWLGTEVFRKRIHELIPGMGEDFWVHSTLNREIPKRLVISDVRFLNEVKGIHERKGRIIKVIRPVLGAVQTDPHESEAGIDLIQNYDYLVINDGTLEDLYEKIDQIVRRNDLLIS